jgi:DNA-directed RNA polymerase beta subunit
MEGCDMEVWQLILYGAAIFLAIRLLVGLMESHRRLTLKRLMNEQQISQLPIKDKPEPASGQTQNPTPEEPPEETQDAA